MHEGQTVYRVEWSDGIPHIGIGTLKMTGNKRKKLRPVWRSDYPYKTGCYITKEEAIAEDIGWLVKMLMPRTVWSNRNPGDNQPYRLAGCIAELMRLRARLMAHNLWP